jgi:predicted enzyme related to lactoylglutathione lyase
VSYRGTAPAASRIRGRGWAQTRTRTAPEPVDGYRLFAWNDSGVPVRGMSNTARLPSVHPHWLFYLPVTDIDDAAARVRTLGGSAMQPFILPNGMRLVSCEDRQGAAFGLAQIA